MLRAEHRAAVEMLYSWERAAVPEGKLSVRRGVQDLHLLKDGRLARLASAEHQQLDNGVLLFLRGRIAQGRKAASAHTTVACSSRRYLLLIKHIIERSGLC